MQNTTSCTLPVQNAAYCTSIAANALNSNVGKDCEAGERHQSKCNCRRYRGAFQGPLGGEYPRDYRLVRASFGCSIERGTPFTSQALIRIDTNETARVAW
jgi:hypothetical protein